jgi:hypothetical protein
MFADESLEPRKEHVCVQSSEVHRSATRRARGRAHESRHTHDTKQMAAVGGLHLESAARVTVHARLKSAVLRAALASYRFRNRPHCWHGASTDGDARKAAIAACMSMSADRFISRRKWTLRSVSAEFSALIQSGLCTTAGNCTRTLSPVASTTLPRTSTWLEP